MNDLEKYVLEQAKIEVEHTRSWPNKILAFFVAINAGLVTTLFALAGRTSNSIIAPCWTKAAITGAVLLLLAWVFYLLQKNHRTYLSHRKLQIEYQLANREEIEKRFTVPYGWFVDVNVSLGERWQGWGFYFYLVVLVSSLSIIGVWVA